MESIHKPYARYWWFASEIVKKDVRYNLEWLRDHGFGGVEIAWVYPLNAKDKRLDTAYTPRQEWLSPEWRSVVAYTLRYADSIGLACDMTLGTLWPFGDSYVTYEDASQIYYSHERQKIRRSWEHPKEGYVVDHLSPDKYIPYFERLLDSFPLPVTRFSNSMFVDSWEVETRGLWTDDFDRTFKEKYGYDIAPVVPVIYEKGNEHYLYDYMKLISEKVIGFYSDFDSTLDAFGYFSRGQCSGAPCDIISAYAKLDIPEGEAMLYEPGYNKIPASAALLSAKKVVSAETFTCLYGWPDHYIRKEQIADLKLIADALFANGINHIIWHGKPHNPYGQDSVSFYASVHLGQDGSLSDELPRFNDYLAKVSEKMKKGIPYTDIAVYLPLEDNWMKGEMPKEKQFIWAWGYYEMRYVVFPDDLNEYAPFWINYEFLEKAKIENGKLKVGNAIFNMLYIDVEFMDFRSLEKIVEHAKNGLKIILKNQPLEPGINKHSSYRELLSELIRLSNVYNELPDDLDPFISGEDIPEYFARIDDEELYIFFATPGSKELKFPVDYGQSFMDKSINKQVTVYFGGVEYELELLFEPYQSLLYRFQNGVAQQIDIDFIPLTPLKIERGDDFEAPWLVKE